MNEVNEFFANVGASFIGATIALGVHAWVKLIIERRRQER